MIQYIEHINENIIGGVAFALFAVLVGTRPTVVGCRDYIYILVMAVLGSANIIEHWFLHTSFLTSCLIGFCVGFLADDIYLNLKATIPDFVKQIVDDVLQSIKDWIRRVIGRGN